jgi:replicative DNA helicase
VEDIPDLRLSDIRTRARRLQAEHGLSCLVIDYLQLLSGEQANEKRYDEVSRLSRGMKKLAKSLGLPIVCLAQLNRGSEARADKRPMMSDLRDSGAIEQDADVIVFVHRESQYDPAADREAAELIIAKGRGGPVGTVPIRYIREFTRFEEVH